MRAVRWDQKLSLDANASMPEVGPSEALVRVRYAGICNTDLEIMKGYKGFTGILGHEFVGDVVQGPLEWIGKRVCGEINVADGTCEFCRRGIPSQCLHRTTVGINGRPGVFADYVALPVANLAEVPPSVTDRAAVFVEPLAACLQITESVHISPRHRVVVLGAGKLGLLAAQVLRLTGAQVFVVVRRPRPTALLQNWGIQTLATREAEDDSANFVVDCTGTDEGLSEALRIVEPRGTIVLKSTYAEHSRVDMSRVVVDEVRIIGSRCGPFDAAIRLLARGLIETESLVEQVYPLEEMQRAFDDAAQPGRLKVLLAINP